LPIGLSPSGKSSNNLVKCRRPTGMESVRCAVGAAVAAGAASDAAGAGETVTATDSFGLASAAGDSADGPRGVVPAGAGVPGLGLSPAVPEIQRAVVSGQ
jgi:hypothetical protein